MSGSKRHADTAVISFGLFYEVLIENSRMFQVQGLIVCGIGLAVFSIQDQVDVGIGEKPGIGLEKIVYVLLHSIILKGILRLFCEILFQGGITGELDQNIDDLLIKCIKTFVQLGKRVLLRFLHDIGYIFVV